MPFEDHDCIRIRPELRPTQVNETLEMAPALTFYFDEKYDLGRAEIPDNCLKVSFRDCLRRIATSRARLLEVPEPLWMRFAPKNLLLMAVWKSSGFIFSRPREIITYAIENNAIEDLLYPNRSIPRVVVRLFMRCYGFIIYTFIDRIAFGSIAARELYSSLGFFGKTENNLIEELPTANPDYIVHSNTAGGSRVIFVGALDDRKGILDLMATWDDVESNVNGAEIKIIGQGKYSETVSAWCQARPDSRSFLGFVEHSDIGAHMTTADVLVAPSRRDGRWREQIGLPIAEALSLGLTVVTTDETGLAQWLTHNGHYVIPEPTVRAALAESIAGALRVTLPRSSVIDSLPQVAGRIAADQWLQGDRGRC